ncbi:MAG: transglycosylase SLT domain-containing protein [Methylocystis sp.]|nr:transglycosylase SLT domain-containing protein [Methylocystis sp.]
MRARDARLLIRSNQLFQFLVRACGVTLVFASIFLGAPFSASDNTSDAKPSANTARPRGASVAPFVPLGRRDANEVPLDADFSMDEAALAWAHRLDKLDAKGENDAPGVLRFGPMLVQSSIVERVVQAAKTTDTDPALLMAIADKESSFAPSAKARASSASGLFQFVEKTWFAALRAFGWRYGREREADAITGTAAKPQVAQKKRLEILRLRNDPYLSAALAAEMLKRDAAEVSGRLGRRLTAGETYLIHFLGPRDAARFMAKVAASPNASAARLLPRPAKANKPIFFARAGRKMKDRSVGEVHEAFEAMMGLRSARYQNVENKLPGGALAYTN